MQIGGRFNKKCEQILFEAGKISGMKSGYKIAVEQVNRNIGLSRNEMRLYLEYMRDKRLIELITFGGPLLYGHIILTKAGLIKVGSIKQ